MKVAIVGGAPRSKDLAPYDDAEWEIWGLGVHQLPRVDKIFEIHPSYQFEKDDYPQRLVDLNIPLVVHENFPFRSDNVEIFPFEEAGKFGKLTSSIAYMVAYAVIHGATHISIYGVDMDVDDKEYFYQRPGLYAWLGYAEGLGIEVNIPNSTLYHDAPYPMNILSDNAPYTEEEFRKMADLHQNKMNECQAKIKELQDLHNVHYGCKQVYDRLAKIGRATDAGIEVKQIDHSTVIRR